MTIVPHEDAMAFHLTGTKFYEPITDPAFLARLQGQIAWVEAVNPARGHRLRIAFDTAFA